MRPALGARVPDTVSCCFALEGSEDSHPLVMYAYGSVGVWCVLVRLSLKREKEESCFLSPARAALIIQRPEHRDTVLLRMADGRNQREREREREGG